MVECYCYHVTDSFLGFLTAHCADFKSATEFQAVTEKFGQLIKVPRVGLRMLNHDDRIMVWFDAQTKQLVGLSFQNENLFTWLATGYTPAGLRCMTAEHASLGEVV